MSARRTSWSRDRVERVFFGVARWVVIVGMLLATVLPFYYMLLLSVRPIQQLLLDPADLLPSLQVGIEDPGSNTGVCGWGYSCAYTNSISWAGAAQPLPHEINPQLVFERLYGDGVAKETARILEYQRAWAANLTQFPPVLPG